MFHGFLLSDAKGQVLLSLLKKATWPMSLYLNYRDKIQI